MLNDDIWEKKEMEYHLAAWVACTNHNLKLNIMAACNSVNHGQAVLNQWQPGQHTPKKKERDSLGSVHLLLRGYSSLELQILGVF